MSIYALKSGNLAKLLDGLSSLDNEDQERIIGIVDALDFSRKRSEEGAGVRLCGASVSKKPHRAHEKRCVL